MTHPNHDWLCLEIEVPPDDLDEYVSLLWELGTAGLQEVPGESAITVKAFFPGSISEEELLRGFQAVAGEEAHVRIYQIVSDPEDWVENYKKNFHGFAVGRSFYIHPSWEDGSRDYPINLVIDPGHAFGTGTHESTQLCLLALEDLAPEASSVADVGTGSGILALAACRLNGQASVVAIDNDWQAIEMARENLLKNGAGGVWLAAGKASALKPGFDLVVANLAYGIFQQAAAEVARLCGRDLVISGFTSDQAPQLVELFLAQGLRQAQRWDLNGWVCLRLTATNRLS